jgi:hypothetical protein
VAIYVKDLYLAICDELLEPGGLQLGIFTVDNVLDCIKQSVSELLGKSYIYKTLFVVPCNALQAIYDQPPHSEGIEEGWYDNETITTSTAATWDTTDWGWPSDEAGKPYEYKEDSVGVFKFQTRPTPAVSGFYTNCPPSGWYGTFSSTASPVVYDVTPTANFYGTISDASTGDVYVESVGAFLGIPADIQISNGNFMFTTYNKTFKLDVSLDGFIDIAPDSMFHVIMAGALYRLYFSNSEDRNQQLGKYWKGIWDYYIQFFKFLSDTTPPRANKGGQ